MIPTFALVFGEDTVSLLHRTQGEWTPLGDARLDDDDLADRLVALREMAEAHGPVITKLALPPSQILFTRIPLQDGDAADQVRAALDGLTPYDVAELEYDWEIAEGHAHLAVVARETLHEAEGFATDYGFNPVAFTAVAPEGRLPAEPWFGPTMVAARFTNGAEVERDSLALHPTPPALPIAAEEEPPVSPEPEVTEDWAEVEAERPQEPKIPEEVAPLADPVSHWDGMAVLAETPSEVTINENDPEEHWDDALPPAAEDEPGDDPEAHWSDAPSLPERDGPLSEEPAPPPVDEVAAAVEPAKPDAAPEEFVPEPDTPPTPPADEPEPIAPVAPQVEPPVFDHPSFARKPVAPTLRAERAPVPPRRVPPIASRVAPPVTAPKGEAPIVEVGRVGTAPAVDMTPPPLRVTQSRSRAERARAAAAANAARPKPKLLGVVLTVLLLLALAFVAAASAYFLDSEPAAASSAAVQPSAATDLADAAVMPAVLAAPAPFGPSLAPEAPGAVARVQLAEADPTPAVITPAAYTETEAPAAVPGLPPRARPAPPASPAETETTVEAAPALTDAASAISEVASLRPRLRPEDLTQPTDEELSEADDGEGALAASPRPQERPEDAANAGIVRIENNVGASDDTGTALAVAVSQRPVARPSGISRQAVNDALAAAMAAPPEPVVAPKPLGAIVAAAPVAPVAPARVAPQVTARAAPEADDEPEPPRTALRIPTKASVAQQATQTAALPMGKANVISITGSSTNRTALIRQSNGRISRVRVGDRVEGGVVAAITSDAIHYRKGNTLYALKMPS